MFPPRVKFSDLSRIAPSDAGGNGLSAGRKGWYRRFFAWSMAKGTAGIDLAVGSRKQTMLSALRGTVVEIGPGTGANLRHYAPEVRFIGIEPNLHMHPYLLAEAARLGREVDLRTGFGEGLDLADESVDAVVTTHVLCSVSDIDRVIAEAHRVLRPGGRLCFLEHVGAPRGSLLRRFQSLIGPLWSVLGDGCRPDRDPLSAPSLARFSEVRSESFRISVPIIGPHLAGVAVK